MKITFKLSDDIELSLDIANADTDEIEKAIGYFNQLKPYLESKGAISPRRETAAKESHKQEKPTEKQIAILTKFNIPFDDTTTREGASKLIEESMKRSR